MACGKEFLQLNNKCTLFQNNTPGFSICRTWFVWENESRVAFIYNIYILYCNKVIERKTWLIIRILTVWWVYVVPLEDVCHLLSNSNMLAHMETKQTSVFILALWIHAVLRRALALSPAISWFLFQIAVCNTVIQQAGCDLEHDS